MYLRGRAPYFFAAFSTGLVGMVMLLEYFGWIHRFALKYPSDDNGPPPLDGLVSVGRVRGLRQRLVDGGLLHHLDPPLRGSGTRRNPAEGKDAGHRAVGGRHRPPNRQSAGRRAKLPAADRRAGERRSAPDRIRAIDGRGPGANRAHGQARAGLRPAARHHPAKHRREPGGRGHAGSARRQPRQEHPNPHRAGRRAPRCKAIRTRCRKCSSTSAPTP